MNATEAGWFVDPLGRFSGRFFDGTRWTEKVSEDGAPQIDRDWLSKDADIAHVEGPDDDLADAAGSRSHGYELVIPAAPPVTHCGGRTDRRQVQIPVSNDRRRRESA